MNPYTISSTSWDLLTPIEAAAELGLSLSRVHKLCRSGRLGFSVGGRYVIDRVELDLFKQIPRPVGNPNFGKRRNDG
jgi:excisionase family DNA binding protein